MRLRKPSFGAENGGTRARGAVLPLAADHEYQLRGCEPPPESQLPPLPTVKRIANPDNVLPGGNAVFPADLGSHCLGAWRCEANLRKRSVSKGA
jgi:hypothetical protein